jgi:ankyrin repeat protein
MEMLTTAIKTGDAQKVTEILDQQPDLTNQLSEGGASPLLLAIYYGHQAIAKLIVDRGHVLSIHEAAALGDLVRVRELVEAESELANRVASDGHLPLGLACFFLHEEIVEYLLEKGANVNAASQNNQRVAPLHAASASRSVSIVRTLLEHGADPNARQNGGSTALHSAAQNGQVEMIQLLLRHSAQANARTEEGETPLDLAQRNNFTEAITLLKSG